MKDNNVSPYHACLITFPMSPLFLFEILFLALFRSSAIHIERGVAELHLNDLKASIEVSVFHGSHVAWQEQ